MRTKTLLLTAALSAAGIATSMAQVYSVNAVGYVNTQLVPGFNLVSNPLDNTTGNTIQNLFGTGFQGGTPPGTLVYYFDPNTDGFVTATFDPFDLVFTPPAAANTVVDPGNGVFVFISGNANATCTFVGEVPQGARSNTPIPQGFSIKASAVPQAGTVAALQFPGVPGDILYKWNPTTDAYQVFTFDPFDNVWTPSVPNIEVGEAFFILKAAATTWTRNFSVNP
jgi:hypothetical protein